MNDADILQALQNATKLAVAASTAPTIPVAFKGVVFEKPADNKFVEVVFIPNNRENGYWGSERDYRGLYRLILHWPINSGGAYTPMRLAASIGSYFSKDLFLQGGVKITDVPNLTGVLDEGSETLYPITVTYQAFAA